MSMHNSLVAALVHYHCILKNKGMKDQFVEGLKVLGILNMVRTYPLLMKKFFVHDNKHLSADTVFIFSFQCM